MLIVHAAHSRLIVLDEQMHIQKEEEKTWEVPIQAYRSVLCILWEMKIGLKCF